MAQYWEDWSGSTLGNEPTGWTKRWTTTNWSSLTVQSDAAAPGGRSLRVVKSTSGRAALSMDAVDADAGRDTIEIALLVRPVNPNTAQGEVTQIGAITRGAGSGGSETGCVLACAVETAGVSGTDLVGYTYTSGSADTPIRSPENGIYTNGEVYWLKVTASGTSLSGTFSAEATPGTAIASVSRATSLTNAGWAGIFGLASTSNTWDILAVGIGTGGDPAPLSEPSSGLAGDAVASATATGALNVPTVKGVRVHLHDGSTPQASVSGLKVAWWDSPDPSAYGAPVYQSGSEATDESGWLELDLDATTSLALAAEGWLTVTKPGATAEDDITFSGRLPIVDIS